MKNIFLLLLTAVLLSGCNDPDNQTARDVPISADIPGMQKIGENVFLIGREHTGILSPAKYMAAVRQIEESFFITSAASFTDGTHTTDTCAVVVTVTPRGDRPDTYKSMLVGLKGGRVGPKGYALALAPIMKDYEILSAVTFLDGTQGTDVNAVIVHLRAKR